MTILGCYASYGRMKRKLTQMDLQRHRILQNLYDGVSWQKIIDESQPLIAFAKVL